MRGEHTETTSRRPRRTIGLIAAAVLSLIVVFVGAGYGYLRYEWSKVHKAACSACTGVSDGKPYDVLLSGSDSRAHDTGQAARSFGTSSSVGGQRSDSIKIVRVDPASGTARVLSIPRDTYVTMSGLAPSTGLTGAQKINTAFNNGPDALIETIENTFGIPITHYVVIDFNAVIDSVKTLGGIALDFRYPVRDDNEGVDESGLDITRTGCQDLNGNTVLALSRSRYYEYDEDGQWQMDPGYDISRIQRQNTIIEAMLAKARSTYNPLTLHSLVDSVVNDVTVDDKMSLGTIYDLADRYHAFSPSSLQTWTLPTVGEYTPSRLSVQIAAVDGADNYRDTIAAFLGGAAHRTVTPPLDAYGDPLPVPTTTSATTGTSSTGISSTGTSAPVTTKVRAGRSPTTSAPPVSASAVATTTLPPYDPTVC